MKLFQDQKRIIVATAILGGLTFTIIPQANAASDVSQNDALKADRVVLKEDPRLSVSISLATKERTAKDWAESIGDAAHLPIVLPEDAKNKRLFLDLDKKPLKHSLDAIGDALRLTWKLSKDQIVFEPAKIDPAEEMVDAWPADAREILDMPDSEKGPTIFKTAGDVFDNLTAEERAALSTGKLIDIGQLQPETRERLWKLWLYPNVKHPQLNFSDPNLFRDGSLTLTDDLDYIDLNIKSPSFSITHHWKKGTNDFPSSYDHLPLKKAILVPSPFRPPTN
jgi:hypothetical protein